MLRNDIPCLWYGCAYPAWKSEVLYTSDFNQIAAEFEDVQRWGTPTAFGNGHILNYRALTHRRPRVPRVLIMARIRPALHHKRKTKRKRKRKLIFISSPPALCTASIMFRRDVIKYMIRSSAAVLPAPTYASTPWLPHPAPSHRRRRRLRTRTSVAASCVQASWSPHPARLHLRRLRQRLPLCLRLRPRTCASVVAFVFRRRRRISSSIAAVCAPAR
jgi:hypothetical protein